ncbi:MAG TPA: hypothetical protein VGA80_14430, partial [Flavobacteriaceae bacterium]
MDCQLLKLNKLIKILVTTGFLLNVFYISYSQNPYYDAISLSKYELDTDGNIILTNDEGYEIINRYLIPAKNRTQNKISSKWDSTLNPFFGLVQGAEDAHGEVINLKQSKSYNIGGLNVTNIADGLAKFLVKRTKEELSIAFFDKFQKELDSLEDLRILFPKTHSLLTSIGDEIYNFSGYTNMLRETFQEDLKTIIPNLRILLNSGQLDHYLTINPTIKVIFNNALLIAENLQNGVHPGDVLTDLKNENLNDRTIRNLSPSIQVLDLVSQSLRSKQKERYWISSDSLKLLIEDETTFKIYLGLIYQQSEGIEFENKYGNGTIKFKTILDSLGSKVQEYKNNVEPLKAYINKLVANAERVDRSLKAIKNIDSK